MSAAAKALAALLLATAIGPAFARTPDDAPRLPQKTGQVVVVSDVDALYAAVAGLKSDTTIVLSRGTYRLRRSIHIGFTSALKNVVLRGETGDFNDVVVTGAGMGNLAVGHGILAEKTDGLLIADMTIGWVGQHAIALHPGALKNVHVYHCRLVDAGQQLLKVSLSGPASAIHDGIVEYCLLEYTQYGPEDGYTNGVDVLGGHNWVIRHNLFRSLRGSRTGKMAGPAVLAWQGAADTRCEQNTFLNCDRAVAFGLVQRSEGHDHRGGIVSNNFIAVNKDQINSADAGIIVWDSPGTKVLHNTVWLDGTYRNAIEVRWDSSKDIAVENNLTDAGIATRDGATVKDAGNQSASREIFKNVVRGDLHLVPGVRFQTVPVLPDCSVDWDDGKRPAAGTTAGADDPSAG